MSLSQVKDILKLVEEVPTEFAQKFVNMLNSLISSFASLAAKHLETSRYKRTPSIPHDFLMGKEDKVPGLDIEEQHDKRMKGPR